MKLLFDISSSIISISFDDKHYQLFKFNWTIFRMSSPIFLLTKSFTILKLRKFSFCLMFSTNSSLKTWFNIVWNIALKSSKSSLSLMLKLKFIMMRGTFLWWCVLKWTKLIWNWIKNINCRENRIERCRLNDASRFRLNVVWNVSHTSSNCHLIKEFTRLFLSFNWNRILSKIFTDDQNQIIRMQWKWKRTRFNGNSTKWNVLWIRNIEITIEKMLLNTYCDGKIMIQNETFDDSSSSWDNAWNWWKNMRTDN